MPALSDHLGEHGDFAFEQPDTALVAFRRDQLSEAQDVEGCGAFHGLAARDLIVLVLSW
jgi:hypothetical protein